MDAPEVFTLFPGYQLRRRGETLQLVQASSPDEPGTVLAETGLDSLISAIASFSPFHEEHGSFCYVSCFVRDGIMRCAGCGNTITRETAAGCLYVIDSPVCLTCYQQKFKPFLDWELNDEAAPGKDQS
jgi:hypothetical protein